MPNLGSQDARRRTIAWSGAIVLTVALVAVSVLTLSPGGGWAYVGALGAAGTNADKVGMAALGQVGVVYQGMTAVGGGSVLAGMILGAMATFIIDRKLNHAAVTAFIGAALAFVGLIHGPALGWMVSPLISLGYVMFGVLCLAMSRQEMQPAS